MRLMKSLSTSLTVFALVAIVSAQSAVSSLSGANTSKLAYPVAHRTEVVDDYHGTKVADPYRWLEDLDSPPTTAWVEAENKLTFGFLESLPQREYFRERLTKLWNYPRIGIPVKEGGRYFFSKNAGLQAQDRLIHELPQEPKWFVRGGTTEDGRWVVISISRGSSFENLLSVIDLADPMAPKLDAPVTPLISQWDAEYSVIGNDGPVLYV